MRCAAVGTNETMPLGALHARALVRSEIEQLVLADRSAHAPAELVALEGVLRDRKELPRVEVAVADELEHGAVDIVCAGARHDVDHAAAGVAVLRGEVAREKTELLNGIRIGKWLAGVQISVVVIAAVHLEIYLAADGAGNIRAIDARRLFAGVDAALAADAAAVPSGIDRARGQVHEPLRPPAVERKLLNRDPVDDLAAGPGSRGDQFGFPGDGNPAAQLADL
jgi:hypothetical protein